MESSSNKCGVNDIPKRNRSLDLKSLYESRASRVRGTKKKGVSDESDHDVKRRRRRKRKNRKEFPLSCFRSEDKKTSKEEVEDLNSEQDFPHKSNGKNPGPDGISLAFSDVGTSFIIPKRPRGSVDRKKLKVDQEHESLITSNSANHVEAKVHDTVEDARLGDNSVRSGTPSTANGDLSNLKTARRFSGYNSKSTRKTGVKATVNSFSSKEKLKQKVEADEVIESGSDNSCSVVNDVKGENSDLNLNPEADPKIAVKSSRSSLNLRPKVDTSEPKEKSNDHLASGKGAEKQQHNTEERKKKRVRKRSYVQSEDSNPKINVKLGVPEQKEQDDVKKTADLHEGSVPINDGDGSSKKFCGKRKRKIDLVVVRDSGEVSRKKSEASAGSSVSNNHFTDFLDDEDEDEENLEKNAARMLSSRFDPNFTGYSSRRSSASQKPDGSYFRGLSTRRSFSSHAKFDRKAADDKSRALRPRREDKVKGTRRKRRHFYEILADDFDPYWVLNQRVKIFWPLDESWYYGLVDDYHSESRLHHIKYDDRDEEWVNLPEEKFKILLLPSEAPGRSKTRKLSGGDRDSQEQENTTRTDGNHLTENSLDSEPIASWLGNQPQLVKVPSKTLKGQRHSLERQSLAASLSSGETGESDADFLGPKANRDEVNMVSDLAGNVRFRGSARNSLPSSSSLSLYNVVYVRKRYREKILRGSSVLRNVKVHATIEEEKDFDWTSSNVQLWFSDGFGMLRLNDVLMRSKGVRFHVHLPVIPFSAYSFEVDPPWLAYYTFMLRNGVMVSHSPAVLLEILFIDNDLGLKLLLFDGCLRQAIDFVFIILILFRQSKQIADRHMRLPVTSIRFRLFSVYDLKKRHVLAFYSFYGLSSAKWLYLDSKVLQHCHLIKKLSVLEFTYDKIKEFEYGSSQHGNSHAEVEISSNAYYGPGKKLMPDILPKSISWEHLSANPGNLPQFPLSFTAAPTFFQSLHMQLLMENGFACLNLCHQDQIISNGKPVAEYTHGTKDFVVEAPASTGLPSYCNDHQINALPSANISVSADLSHEARKLNPNDTRLLVWSADFTESTKKISDESRDYEAWDTFVSPHTSVPKPSSSPSFNLRESASSGLVDISSSGKVDVPINGNVSISGQISDMDWDLHESFVHSSSPAGYIKPRKRGRTSFLKSPVEYQSPLLPDGMPNYTARDFSNGPKKPRTQVQYSLPLVGYDFSSKQKISSPRAMPYKRIRRASLKRSSDSNVDNQKILDSLTCDANILVTQGNRGWRESGANVVLEVADHNEWKLTVKHDGVPKYYYKVKHILQPGSTNRYTHAMMWKGGKDWMLEFPGRNQWMLFKEMHEECYNRNIRAASLKNIPIPGVRLVEECDEYAADASFTRNSARYIRQVQNDAEMAMDPSRILYDMDSDDERWLVENSNLADRHEHEGISEAFFEKAIDIFEKFSYAQLRDNFTDSEVEELVMGLGSVESGKLVYEHWKKKREKMGMPLIRHLQPPLWETYQQKLKEWDLMAARSNIGFSNGGHGRRILPEKPPMFAFCLKPRGLEVPNKFSKQRSHRKLPIGGTHHPSSGNQESLHGRISNGHFVTDERMLHPSSVLYSSNVSPSLLASTRVLSPRDTDFSLSIDAFEWKGPPELSIPRNYYLGGAYNLTGKQQNNADIHEFHLRDASAAASHARAVAKLKRHKAHKLFCKADAAIHRAATALMVAEAIKDSAENSAGTS